MSNERMTETESTTEHGCLVALVEKWERPFYKPVAFNLETGELTSGWAAQMWNQTPSGGISKNGKAHLYINFCPICGAELTGE